MVEGGDDDDRRGVRQRLEGARRREPVEHRHPHVDEGDVQPRVRLDRAEEGTAVLGQHGHLDVRLRGQDHREALAHELLVVDDRHPDHDGATIRFSGR